MEFGRASGKKNISVTDSKTGGNWSSENIPVRADSNLRAILYEKGSADTISVSLQSGNTTAAIYSDTTTATSGALTTHYPLVEGDILILTSTGAGDKKITLKGEEA